MLCTHGDSIHVGGMREWTAGRASQERWASVTVASYEDGSCSLPVMFRMRSWEVFSFWFQIPDPVRSDQIKKGRTPRPMDSLDAAGL